MILAALDETGLLTLVASNGTEAFALKSWIEQPQGCQVIKVDVNKWKEEIDDDVLRRLE